MYKSLTALLKDLSNGGSVPPLLPTSQWAWPSHSPALEWQASQLSPQQAKVLVCDGPGQDQVISQYPQLWDFMLAVGEHDGTLRNNFFVQL